MSGPQHMIYIYIYSNVANKNQFLPKRSRGPNNLPSWTSLDYYLELSDPTGPSRDPIGHRKNQMETQIWNFEIGTGRLAMSCWHVPNSAWRNNQDRAEGHAPALVACHANQIHVVEFQQKETLAAASRPALGFQ